MDAGLSVSGCCRLTFSGTGRSSIDSFGSYGAMKSAKIAYEESNPRIASPTTGALAEDVAECVPPEVRRSSADEVIPRSARHRLRRVTVIFRAHDSRSVVEERV